MYRQEKITPPYWPNILNFCWKVTRTATHFGKKDPIEGIPWISSHCCFSNSFSFSLSRFFTVPCTDFIIFLFGTTAYPAPDRVNYITIGMMIIIIMVMITILMWRAASWCWRAANRHDHDDDHHHDDHYEDNDDHYCCHNQSHYNHHEEHAPPTP